MFDLSILVVIYGRSISDSSTLQSLKSNKLLKSTVSLTIWNNGPVALDTKNELDEFIESGFETSYVETISNLSLAEIYNKFILENSSASYVILDHDSFITNDLFNSYLRFPSNKVGLPKIDAMGEIKAPFINGQIISKDYKFKNNDLVTSIGSGVIIGSSVICDMKKRFIKVFDERFYLYGVDTTFFKRIYSMDSMDNSVFMLLPELKHSLSRLEKEDKLVTSFRIIERSYDFGLVLRYYTPVYLVPIRLSYQLLKHVKKLILKEKIIYNFKHVLRALVTGRHYRS
ncbi:hypothetical protein AB4302_05535 [Vibrio breoganii]